MFETILKLVILFIVIIDPFLSLAFFISNTEKMSKNEKIKTATKSMILAFIIVFVFLLFGDLLLKLFSLEITHFRIAGGIILGILGIKMVLGLTFKSSIETETTDDTLPTIIATPLISGPACITTILISSADYGKLLTGISVSVVLLLTAGLLYFASYLNKKHFGATGIKMTTTIMGLITLAWGVSFIMAGLNI